MRGATLKTLIRSVAGILLTSALAGNLAAAPPSTFQWQTATPESRGMSTPKLDALKEHMAAKKTDALLVIRGDRIVYEWYVEGNSATKPHGTASLAKAIVGGLSL